MKPIPYVAAAALTVLLAAGCAKGPDRSTQTTTSTTAAKTPSVVMQGAVPPLGDPARGKQIYAANCVQCHGATGVEGGIGPSLRGEKLKRNYGDTIVWIHDPRPPMPKLWPSPLDDKAVQDVAAYVQTL